MMKRPSSGGPLLVDTLRDVLSPYALRQLELLDVRRDLKQTCSDEELRTALLSRGLPIFEKVIEFERRCGGAFWPLAGMLDVLGTWAAFKELESNGHISAPRLSITCEGEQLLPVCATRGGSDFWMSERGTVFFCDDIDWAPTAESYAILLEREALKRGYPDQLKILLRWYHLPTMTEEDFEEVERKVRSADLDIDEPPRPYEQDPQATFDRRLAEALELPLFQPATDRWRHVWFDGSRLLFPCYPWRESERLLRANDMDGIVRIVRAAQDVRPGVVATWSGPCGEAPAPGEPVAARIPAYGYRRDVYGEIFFIGEPGNYRVHEVEYPERLSAFRLWNERREDWEARRSGNG